MNDEWVWILIILVIMGLVFGLLMLASSVQCNTQTKDIGFPHRWGIMSGCMIEIEAGRWIPLDNWRWLEE